MQTSIKEPVTAFPDLPPAASPNRINHIDGLRGIAIILVLLFHISKAFSNGYIGVHIFLAISGYFLFRNFWNDNYDFSWKEFCSKKIARLLPCAIVVSTCTCLAALCFLPYGVVLKTAKSAIATNCGLSNVYYDYTYSDYFAASSIANPLVHTWYLGVIIQLYIIAGCIMILGKRKSLLFKFAIVSMLFVVSVLLYYMPLWIDRVTPFHSVISTYYWTWGHLWMLLAGAYAHLLLKLGTKIPGKALGGRRSSFNLFAGIVATEIVCWPCMPVGYCRCCCVCCMHLLWRNGLGPGCSEQLCRLRSRKSLVFPLPRALAYHIDIRYGFRIVVEQSIAETASSICHMRCNLASISDNRTAFV